MKDKKIGIETEFFTLDSEGKIAIPVYSNYRDNFPLLAEVRGEPGTKSIDTYINWLKEFKLHIRRLEAYKLTPLLNESYSISPEMYEKCLKEMSSDNDKVIPKNIYGYKNYTNTKTKKDGEIIGYTIYAGLHIHFSYNIELEAHTEPLYDYNLFSVPLGLNIKEDQSIPLHLDLYERKFNPREGKKVVSRENVLSEYLINIIIKELDEKLFKVFAMETNKYRQPGFYEIKDDGRFEYRSLPFNKDVYNNLESIIDTCWDIFNKI